MNRKPDEKPAPQQEGREPEPFLSRWSRRKQEEREAPPQPAEDKAAESRAPALPPVDKLTIESDYRAFFHPKVGEDVRRAALKKLFADPHFNLMDGLDIYIDDYSKTEPIPPAMMAGLRQAQNILRWAKEDTEAREQERLAKEASSKPQEAAGVKAIEPPATEKPAAGAAIVAKLPDAQPAAPDNAAKRRES